MVLPPRWIGVGRVARCQRIAGLRRLQRLGDQAAIDAHIRRWHDRPWRRPSRTATAPAGSSPRCRNSPVCASRPGGSPRSGRPTATPSADRDLSRAAAAVAGSALAPGCWCARRRACVLVRSCQASKPRHARQAVRNTSFAGVILATGGIWRKPMYKKRHISVEISIRSCPAARRHALTRRSKIPFMISAYCSPMRRSSFSKIVAVAVLLALSACATRAQPHQQCLRRLRPE